MQRSRSCLLVLMLGGVALLGCRRDASTTPDAEVPAALPTPLQLDLPAGVIAALGQPPQPADNPLTVEGVALGRKLFQGTVNGKPVSVRVTPLAEGYQLNYAGAEVKATLRTLRVAELGQYMPVRESTVSQFEVTAPIAGLISAIHVNAGDTIRAGQQLFVIEAMKMENIIYADNDAKVKAVHVKAPASVTSGQLVIEFEEP